MIVLVYIKIKIKKALAFTRALKFELVGAAGFEPTTSSTPRKRSTKLSHAPNHKEYYTRPDNICQAIFRLF